MPVFAVITPEDLSSVSMIEGVLFKNHFTDESLEQRLTRIETVVYGQPQDGKMTEPRLRALQTALLRRQAHSQPNISQVGTKPNQASKKSKFEVIAPKTSILPKLPHLIQPELLPLPSFKKKSPNLKDNNPQNSDPKNSDRDDYPTVNTMEKRVFGKNFAREDISQRLARLETQMYGQGQLGTLQARTDRLADTLGLNYNQGTPSGEDPSGVYTSRDNLGGDDLGGTPSVTPLRDLSDGDLGGDNNSLTSSIADIQRALASVEQQVFRKTFINETVDQRLARLEGKIFHQTAPDGTPADARLQRIIAVASASGNNADIIKRSPVQTAGRILPFVIMILPFFL
ncbi:MAG: hypothetical protein K2X01_06665 [Cyanobacteria bacterium]|nr:hypothetical protein [Cyanobacteriota bacterium]